MGYMIDEPEPPRAAMWRHIDAARRGPLRGRLADRDECAAPLRRQAVLMLSRLDSACVEDLLLDLISNDPDPEIRLQAVFWLDRIDDVRAVRFLGERIAEC
jgi:HEAT repeat protein